MSRAAARKKIRGDQLRKQMDEQGIAVRAASLRGLAEEAGFAYKDVDSVVGTVHALGISTKAARLIPLANIKG